MSSPGEENEASPSGTPPTRESLSRQLRNAHSLDRNDRVRSAPKWLEDFETNFPADSQDTQQSQESQEYKPSNAGSSSTTTTPTKPRKTPVINRKRANDNEDRGSKRKQITPKRAVQAIRTVPLVYRPQPTPVAFAQPMQNIAEDPEAAWARLIAKPSPTEINGLVDPKHWIFPLACITVDNQVKQQVLRGCFYEPGVIVNAAQPPTVEICFSFDTTGSMFQCIDELKFQLQNICNTLLSDLPSIRIAMIAHGDYCDAEMFYVMKKMDFTNDFETINKFVNSLKGTGGGDPEEAYELALMEAQQLHWSLDVASCAKVVVIIGDELPHAQPVSQLRIDWREQLEQLKTKLSSDEHSFTCYGIQCLDRPGVDSFYQTLADETNGQFFKLDNFSSITEVFMGLCYRASAEVQLVKHMQAIAETKVSAGESSVSSQPHAQVIVAKPATKLSDEELLKVHQAVHDSSQSSVEIGGTMYDIAVGKAGCRFVRIDKVTFIEQNKEKKTKYAKMALDGKMVTWVVTNGTWGLLIDDEVVRKGTRLSDSQEPSSAIHSQ